MDIEVVEFYTTERDDKKQFLKGSLHVYLIDIETDLRGVFVQKRKDTWFFGLPVLYGFDQEAGQKVRFPVFNFVNQDKNGNLKKVIMEKGKEYIINNVLQTQKHDKENQKCTGSKAGCASS